LGMDSMRLVSRWLQRVHAVVSKDEDA
jgi:hypothetical protein